MKNKNTLTVEIQRMREWISWQKERIRIAKVEIRQGKTQIKRAGKTLKKLCSKNKKNK